MEIGSGSLTECHMVNSQNWSKWQAVSCIYFSLLTNWCGHKLCLGLTDSDSNWSSINILVISLAHLSNLETQTRGSHACNFLHQLNLVEVYCKTFGCNPSTFGWDIIKTRFWEWIFWPIFFFFIFLPIALKHSVHFWKFSLSPTPWDLTIYSNSQPQIYTFGIISCGYLVFRTCPLTLPWTWIIVVHSSSPWLLHVLLNQHLSK